jgi:hypothetical protein
MPKYTDRVYANANPIRHLLKGQDVKMSQVIWELNLRKDPKE